MSRYSAAVCMRGHYRDIMLDAPYSPGRIATAPEVTESFCSLCGAPVTTSCPNCDERILGAHRGVVAAGQQPEKFCFSCGAPYPWADRAALIMQLRNILEFEPGLDDATRLEVAEQIGVLSEPGEDNKRRIKAGQALRDLAPKGWQWRSPFCRHWCRRSCRSNSAFPGIVAHSRPGS